MTGASNTGGRSGKRRKDELGVRRWPLTVIGVLLLLEAVGLVGAGVLNFTTPVPGVLLPALKPWSTPLSVGFLVLAPLAFAAAVGFMRLWPTAWLAAMLLQGLSLAVALVLYFYLPEKPGYLYVGMAYSTFMVFYLNSHIVRTAFRPERPDYEP